MRNVTVTYPAVDTTIYKSDGSIIKGYSSPSRVMKARYHGDTLKDFAIVEDWDAQVHVVNHKIMEFDDV